ncbi:hypothetical protein, partial [Bacteroides pyogenes]|uniref:hypothetical protein n=1 Tax=Bacteroides pyogenes TaxID=310300 RepID=UPI001606812F
READTAGATLQSGQRKTGAADTPPAGKAPEEVWKAMREADTAGATLQSGQRKTGAADTPPAGKAPEEAWKAMREADTARATPQNSRRKAADLHTPKEWKVQGDNLFLYLHTEASAERRIRLTLILHKP